MTAAPVSVDHLAFPTRDLAATDAFYLNVMGATLVHAESGYSPSWKSDYLLITYALSDGTRLSFYDWPADNGPYADDPQMPDDVFHIGLRCRSARDVIAWQNHLFQHKIVYHNEDDGTSRRLFVRDPNGIRFKIFASESAKSDEDHEGRARAVYDEWRNIGNG
ncbi:MULTISPECIES: VOC family protein [Thalassospira]|uniref:VOC family protein n=1 Tax=Thalassospira TaxID=168934 RepID=UPI0003B640A5|nr:MULTISPECIES: VOC family protein [Thalassospira]RCK30112.1 glyoxalase [Thalassospira lucentensis MCCC 1A00383 = DSM 14000]|tara:strand:- start:54648 stop:55136 length:489 start_codon:yes stop_codon:yes gene_type:complete